ncbi:MAG: A/G-specific adenine glycosylase [Pseudomonadales bacterium]|nr:A/G-specific adenine glycosylase [Pseudomonadales bacterium]
MSFTPFEKTRFATSVLKWFDQNGRKSLPWQKNTSPYRVWVSEIMLQQTQVTTVIPYYLRFMKAFPSTKQLALADIDQVLHLWTGLGYYARARNLHKTAKIVDAQFKGRFPATVTELVNLPGIGQSTAGAILSLSRGEWAPILDGNVKRVLTRVHCIEGWYGHRKTADQLWALSAHYTPKFRVAAFNQAMMDLGATICTRGKPKCELCPLSSVCVAHQTHQETVFPHSKPAKKIPIKSVSMLLLRNQQQELLLEQRPPMGIWGGLWSFPEFKNKAALWTFCQNNLGEEQDNTKRVATMRHTFSHYHLDIEAWSLDIAQKPNKIMEHRQVAWYNHKQPSTIGLPAPIIKLIKKAASEIEEH